jgi:hypothetical protein
VEVNGDGRYQMLSILVTQQASNKRYEHRQRCDQIREAALENANSMFRSDQLSCLAPCAQKLPDKSRHQRFSLDRFIAHEEGFKFLMLRASAGAHIEVIGIMRV